MAVSFIFDRQGRDSWRRAAGVVGGSGWFRIVLWDSHLLCRGLGGFDAQLPAFPGQKDWRKISSSTS